MDQSIQAPSDGQRQPFDQALSTKLDLIQIQLDNQPSRLRCVQLRTMKRWHERRVPATCKPQQKRGERS